MERKIEIDQIKGLGIIFMILGHSLLPAVFTKPVCVFHMPLFFIVSGILYKEKSLIEILKRNSKKILVPYFFTCIILLSYYGFIRNRWDWWISIFLGNAYKTLCFEQFYTVGPLWFLPAFFVSSVCFHIVRKIPNQLSQLIIFISLFFLSLFLKIEINLLPFGLMSGIVGAFFMYIGYVYKKCYNLSTNKYFYMLGGVSYVACLLWGNLSMSWHIYKLLLLQIVAAAFAVIILLKIVKRYFYHFKIIAKIGYYSLPIMCIHSIDRKLNVTKEIVLTFNSDSILINGGGRFLFKNSICFYHIQNIIKKQIF